MTEREILSTILENIQTKVSPQIYEAYFSDLQVFSIDESAVTIACKNAFTKQTIEGRFYNTLTNIIKSVLNKDSVDLQLVIKSFTSSNDTKSPYSSNLFNNRSSRQGSSQSESSTTSTQTIPLVQSSTQASIMKQRISESYLNPKYIFDTFIVGSHNQLAHAAALAISDNPGNAYNPFFIYGGVGLGKTHLMQAIGHKVLELSPNTKVLYSTTETFLNEMVQSIRTQKSNAFREKYRAIDVLILDDIQFLSNKEMLQEEFFNTFNTLYQSGKQIIIASDRPPVEISHLEDRIRSRFEGGLVADIKSPNVETRIAIIQKKLIDRNEFLPDPIIAAIAEAIDTNIRELEGALLKVLIHFKTSGNLSVSDIQTILGAKILVKRKKINPLDLMKSVCDHMQIDLKDVKSSKRNYDIAYARQICMYLLKDILNLQLVKIAKHVGRKDHTTVMHGINKIEGMIKKDIQTSHLISELKATINNN